MKVDIIIFPYIIIFLKIKNTIHSSSYPFSFYGKANQEMGAHNFLKMFPLNQGFFSFLNKEKEKEMYQKRKKKQVNEVSSFFEVEEETILLK